jgi:hypothetical protein
MEWSNGDVFTGVTSKNCCYGEGTFTWADGMTYTSKWDFTDDYFLGGFDHLSAKLRKIASLNASLKVRYFLVSLRKRDEKQVAIVATAV